MRHGIDRGLTSTHCRRKHTPCRLPFTRGSPTPPHVLFFDWMVVCESKPSLWQWKEEEYSRCHVTQTFPIHPHRNIVPLGALGRGIPCSFLCQVLTGLRLRSVPKPLAYGSRVFLCVCIHVWVCILVKFVFKPAVLGMPGATTGREWRKSARTEGGKGERGGGCIQRRISAVEFLRSDSVLFLEHNCLVFGWSSLCICLSPFLLILPSRPQCSHLYLEHCLSQLSRTCLSLWEAPAVSHRLCFFMSENRRHTCSV